MVFKFKYTNQFKKNYKQIQKRGYYIEKLKHIIHLLYKEQILPIKYNLHYLTGNINGFIECHIETDWLLILYLAKLTSTIIFSRTGTHSNLFK